MSRHPEPQLLRRLGCLPEAERRELLAHAAECATCRAELTREDPASVFALLALRETPEHSLELLSRRIDQEIDTLPVVRPAGPRVAMLASFAASLLLAGIFGWTTIQNPQIPPIATAEPAVAPVAISADADLGQPDPVVEPLVEERILFLNQGVDHVGLASLQNLTPYPFVGLLSLGCPKELGRDRLSAGR